MTFLSVNFLRFLFFTQRSPFEVERFVPFGSCHRGLIFLSVTWYDITYDTGNERVQVTESGKIMCLGPTDLCFCCSPSVFTYYFFFSWWVRTCWFIVNSGVPQQLVERGWLLGQMQFKYWVPQARLFFSGLKILLSNFSKKTTAEFDFGFHSIYFLSFLLLHLISNFQ